jgi:FlaA1/EpsC-like NDP-sugar epimerase
MPGRSHTRWVILRLGILGSDLLSLYAGLLLAAVARYDGAVERISGRNLLICMSVAVLAFLATSYAVRLHQGRYAVASTDELTMLAAVLATTALITTVLDLSAGHERLLPLSVPLVGAVLAFVLMLGVRLMIRWQREGSLRPRQGLPTLVFGAGDAGQQLIRSMLSDPESSYLPVGLLDDDPDKRHVRLRGVPMLGDRSNIQDVSARSGAEVLVIALPSADAPLIRDISRRARTAGLTIKVLPTLAELLSSKVGIRDVRDIDIADLLGRRQVETHVEAVAGYLRGKRVLVTGAGGSIGSELCRQIACYQPAEIIMLDRDETALHGVQLSMHGQAWLDLPEVVLADIRDAEVLERLFSKRRPDVVFHAAALKHLNMLEQYPEEAWKSNVLGTRNVLRAATRVGVGSFVNISTDKAANPVSVLGQTKRWAERLTAAYAQGNPGRFLSVRFGNVLGSRGSVLDTFTAQIARGGPITVTHPDVTRYFMTIPEAVQLVVQAGAIGNSGEVLVLDMGPPVRIADVAAALIDLAERPINMLFTGLRPGEKLHEELFGAEEVDVRPVHPLISHVPVPPLSAEELAQLDPVPEPGNVRPIRPEGRMASR